MVDNNKKIWWKPALILAINVSSWIIGPIILALIGGKYLDKKFNSTPWFLLGLTTISFLISVFGILKTLKNYLKELEKESKNKNLE